MTELLQRVVAEIEKLPDDEQDAIARRVLAELADERAWAARFNATTDQEWDRLAEAVRHAGLSIENGGQDEDRKRDRN